VNSLYPSLLAAVGVMLIGWRAQGPETRAVLEGTNWMAFAYAALLLIHLFSAANHLFWTLLQCWSLWASWRIFVDGHTRLWSSLVGAAMIGIVQVQFLAHYPFGLWGGVPVVYALGALWFLFVLSTGEAAEQHVLTLSLAFLFSLRWGSSDASGSSLLEVTWTPDPILCDSYWIGGVLLSAVNWVRPLLARVHRYFQFRT